MIVDEGESVGCCGGGGAVVGSDENRESDVVESYKK